MTTAPLTPKAVLTHITVGYFRHPDLRGTDVHGACGYTWHEHGWLDTGGDGITIGPSSVGPFAGQTVTETGLHAQFLDGEDPR